MKVSRVGYTKLGFSKDSFGCCSHHPICKMGTLDCAIEDKDPEAKNYCNCYKRNHNPIRVENSITKKESETDYSLSIGDNGQLSMF